MVLNSAGYFHLHRTALARMAEREGWRVDVLAGGDVATGIEAEAANAVETVPLPRDRLAPAADLRFARMIAARARGADAVHLITIKPVLYGLLAMPRGPRVIATHPGLGRAFDPPAPGPASALRRGLVTTGLRRGYARTGAVATFENAADRDAFVGLGIVPPSRAVALAGAGIDLDAYRFVPREERAAAPDGRLRVLFASRWLARKGLDRTLEAARLARERKLPIAFTIAGWAGSGDEGVVPAAVLREAEARGDIALVGRATDMPGLLAAHDVLLAPSRLREGLPRVVLEAMAVGTPVVAPRMAATEGLVEPGRSALDPGADAGAEDLLRTLEVARDAGLRARLAGEARRRVEGGGYGMEAVGAAFLALYRGEWAG